MKPQPRAMQRLRQEWTVSRLGTARARAGEGRAGAGDAGAPARPRPAPPGLHGPELWVCRGGRLCPAGSLLRQLRPAGQLGLLGGNAVHDGGQAPQAAGGGGVPGGAPCLGTQQKERGERHNDTSAGELGPGICAWTHKDTHGHTHTLQHHGEQGGCACVCVWRTQWSITRSRVCVGRGVGGVGVYVCVEDTLKHQQEQGGVRVCVEDTMKHPEEQGVCARACVGHSGNHGKQGVRVWRGGQVRVCVGHTEAPARARVCGCVRVEDTRTH